MIAIVSKGSPLSSGFFVDSDEATALFLFSRYFPLSDVFIFDSVTPERSDRLEYYNIKKFISKNKFKKYLQAVQAFPHYEQNKIIFSDPLQ